MIRPLLLALVLALAAGNALARGTEVVYADAIAERVTEELGQRQHLAPGAKLELDNKDLRLTVPAAAGDRLVVENLDFEPKSGRVTAYVASAGDDPSTERLRVTGALRYMIELPVLNRYIAPGERITPRDIDRVAFRSDRIAQAVVADDVELVGRTPRRAIRPQEPVRQVDIMMPIVVKKGDLVTIILETPGLRLTVQGRANDDGAQGSFIHVANTKSGRIIDATVAAPGIVTVSEPGTLPR
jgi:flagella basal body P-ring formation protein FlgA